MSFSDIKLTKFREPSMTDELMVDGEPFPYDRTVHRDAYGKLSYIIAQKGSALLRYDAEKRSFDKCYCPYVYTLVRVKNDNADSSTMLEVAVAGTIQDAAFHDGHLFVASYHSFDGVAFYSWKRVSADLDNPTHVRVPWYISSETGEDDLEPVRFGTTDIDGRETLTVVCRDGRTARFEPTGEEEALKACIKSIASSSKSKMTD